MKSEQMAVRSGEIVFAASEVPQLVGKLHEVTVCVSAELPRIIEEVYASIVESDEAYARLPSTIKHDVRTHITFSAGLWFRTLLTGENFTPGDMATVAEVGRRRANQGIPLSSVLRGFRMGSIGVWRAFLRGAGNDSEVTDGLLFTISPYLLQHFDKLAQITSAAYLEEQYQRARWKEALRYELISFVLRFPDDEAGFRKTCGALGVDATASYVATVMDISMPEVPLACTGHGFDQLLMAIAKGTKAKEDSLVRTIHRGRLVVWIPAVRGDSVLTTDGLMRTYVQALIKSVPEIRRIGVGFANSGAAGWAVSMEEGFTALDSGCPGKELETCFMYSDIALYEGILKSDNALRYLDSIVERLAHEPYLLQTLATYFECRQHQKRTSAVLKVHPNTLNYRLTRIEEMLGATLDDANWVARLAVVVRLRGL